MDQGSSTLAEPIPSSHQDQLEAESLKYSSRVGIVLPLTSGWYAIFNARRRLLAIVPSPETIGLYLKEIESTCERPKAKPQLSLEDLGL